MAAPAPGTRMMAGIAAAAVALGVSQLAAIPFGPAADARTAVGSTVIDFTPGPVKEWAIQTFGTADKLFLAAAVLAVIAIVAAVTALAESPKRPIGSIAIALAGIAGGLAVVSRPEANALDVLPTLVGTVCGIAVLRVLTSGRIVDGERRPGEAVDVDPGRRLSLMTIGLLGAGVLSGVLGAIITRRVHSVADDRATFAVPKARVPAPPIPPQVQPADVQLPSFVTDSADFYRIDTALSVPQLARESWKLKIHGMVDREITYTFDDLAQFEVVEKVVTLACVSNPVGGNLISNAVWTGYRVRDLLAAAGVQADADMVMSTSSDGFTAGTPVEALTDQRDALMAITMNGEPLPAQHGYPARLVVPGLYGYVSATKWVVDLELTRFDQAEAYWTRLGWAPKGPIKTESRIDVPRSGQEVPPGAVTFGGVAWAQNRGVRAVEVRIDGPAGEGIWQPAELGASYSGETWRLWSFPWQAGTEGLYTITVRATDNSGEVQTEDQAGVLPDGATGWHVVSFSVR